MSWVITILALVVIFLSQKFYEYHKSNRLFESVKWCVSYNRSAFDNVEPEIKMRGFIIHVQTKKALEEKYRITESDFNIVTEILQSYQQNLLQKYFNGYAVTYRNVSVGEEYFIITLYHFLETLEFDEVFDGHQFFDEDRHLTEYGITYYKLLFIARLFCEDYREWNPNNTHYTSGRIKKILDAKD